MTPRQHCFTLEYLKDLNATQAAARAGYAHPNVQGSQLLANPRVREAVEEELGARAQRLRIDADWILAQLELEATNYDNAGSARIRALELIGKHLGIFAPSRVDVTYPSSFFADL